MDVSLSVKKLRKKYKQQELYDDLTFEIEKGEITALFGPNGCGKSTLLNILAGITKSDSGECEIQNFDPFQFSYVFQSYRESLLPWRSNYDNLALPLQIQKWDAGKIRSRIEELKQFFELDFNLKSRPYELSGGQQQILVFVRALAPKPKLIFLDEPFSALDYENNIRLREKLQKYYLLEKPTIFLISHNIEEAVHVANRIVVFSKKPTRIIDMIENRLPYPRTLETMRTREFDEVKDRILSEFQSMVNL